MTHEPATVDWLLDSDPALRWQVERDVVGAPEAVWRATRARVGTEGFGARLLALRGDDGMWAGGAYFPADTIQDDPRDEGGQPYTATTWSLNALRWWGVDASLLDGTAELLDRNARWEYDDLPYWGGEVDCCINAFTLANGAWLGADVSGLERWFPEHRLTDGGWDCEWVEGSTRSSFHSTLNVVTQLLDHEQLTGGDPELTAARHAGEEYLLERRLLHRASTGEVVGEWATRMAYPFRWVYSALRALDHFRAASIHDDTAADPRLAEAIELVRAARRDDGTWVQEHRYPGRVWFEVDAPVGEPSKWLTLSATRVLAWWDAAH